MCASAAREWLTEVKQGIRAGGAERNNITTPRNPLTSWLQQIDCASDVIVTFLVHFFYNLLHFTPFRVLTCSGSPKCDTRINRVKSQPAAAPNLVPPILNAHPPEGEEGEDVGSDDVSFRGAATH